MAFSKHHLDLPAETQRGNPTPPPNTGVTQGLIPKGFHHKLEQQLYPPQGIKWMLKSHFSPAQGAHRKQAHSSGTWDSGRVVARCWQGAPGQEHSATSAHDSVPGRLSSVWMVLICSREETWKPDISTDEDLLLRQTGCGPCWPLFQPGRLCYWTGTGGQWAAGWSQEQMWPWQPGRPGPGRSHEPGVATRRLREAWWRTRGQDREGPHLQARGTEKQWWLAKSWAGKVVSWLPGVWASGRPGWSLESESAT